MWRCATPLLSELVAFPIPPGVALFESIFGCEEGDDEVAKFSRMARYLSANHPGIAAAMTPILASFMSLPACAPFADINQPLPVRREAELSMLVRPAEPLGACPDPAAGRGSALGRSSTLELVRSLVESETMGFPDAGGADGPIRIPPAVA